MIVECTPQLPQNGRPRRYKSLSCIFRKPPGMHPVNWLLLRDSHSRMVRLPSSAGISPVNWLLLRSESNTCLLWKDQPAPAESRGGGDRQANAALYRVVLVRLSHDLRTREYMLRRTGEGMSKTEVIRCLKRYVAREVFSALRHSCRIPRTAP